MNPFVWRREHQIALILGALLGAVVLIVVRFMYHGLNYEAIFSAAFWSTGTARWAILGAVIGGILVYVRKLLQI